MWLVQHRTRKTLCWVCIIATYSCHRTSLCWALLCNLVIMYSIIFTQWFSGIFAVIQPSNLYIIPINNYIFISFCKHFICSLFFDQLQCLFSSCHYILEPIQGYDILQVHFLPYTFFSWSRTTKPTEGKEKHGPSAAVLQRESHPADVYHIDHKDRKKNVYSENGILYIYI